MGEKAFSQRSGVPPRGNASRRKRDRKEGIPGCRAVLEKVSGRQMRSPQANGVFRGILDLQGSACMKTPAMFHLQAGSSQDKGGMNLTGPKGW